MWVGGQADLFSQKKFSDRVRLISVLVAIFYGVIVLRLFVLQVIRGDDLARLSESNRTQVLFLRAPRGDFYDRKGKLFVTNRPSWSLMYTGPEELKDQVSQVQNRLAPFLEPFPKRWMKRLQYSFRTGQMVRLAEDVPDRISFGLREMGELLPGLRVVMEFRRGYPLGFLAGHLVGYLGEIDVKELRQEYWKPRKLGDLIGKSGLEKILDSSLRGRDGGMLIEVDSVGRLKKVMRNLPYHKGTSVHLNLDVEIQRKAQDLMNQTKTKRGAVVVIDVNTGAILSWVSSPTFDPSENLGEALTDENKPFFDRVYKAKYPPGSIFKIITALAGFENSHIKIKEKIDCKGFVYLKGRTGKARKFRCWTKHGKVDYWKAMAQSCDSYFYLLGAKTGVNSITQLARKFGLGQRTQKFIPGEEKGLVPTPQWKRKQPDKGGGWSTGDTYNLSIGQGFLETTPLQMGLMMAAVANKGTLWRPQIIKRITDQNSVVNFQADPVIWKKIELDMPIWAAMHESLRRVVKMGTGRGAQIPYLDVRGKTGTAQNQSHDHAWFIAYAGYPGEDPQVAICVFVENGGSGGTVAAPIARQILEVALPPISGEVSI